MALVARAELEGAAVADEFGIGLFAEHDDRDVGPRRVAPVGAQRRGAAGRGHGLADPANRSTGAGKIGVGEVGALPGDRPAAGLVANVVAPSPATSTLAPGDRQQLAVVLEQHQRFAHRLAGDRAMLGRAEQRRSGRRRAARRRTSSNRPARILTRRMRRTASSSRAMRDLAGPDLGQGVGVERFQLSGAMNMSSPALNDCGQERVGAALDLAVRVPVADDEAVEAHLVAYDAGQQALLPGILAPPAARSSPSRSRRRPRSRADSLRRGCRAVRPARTLSPWSRRPGAAVGEEMLGGGDDMAGAEEIGRARRPCRPSIIAPA